jgi:hypothetical protein
MFVGGNNDRGAAPLGGTTEEQKGKRKKTERGEAGCRLEHGRHCELIWRSRIAD